MEQIKIDNQKMNKKPNFLFFMPETLRADAVFGNPECTAKTPVMDKIGQEGVCFTNCFTQSPFCTPSRCSMFTGLYPHTSGHRSLLHFLHSHERNLFQDLKEGGYTTVAFGKNDLLSQDSIAASFDAVEQPVKAEKPKHSSTLWGKDHKYFRGCYIGSRGKEPYHDNDWAIIENALRFLDEDHEKPFCLFLPLAFVHPPYKVEEPYFSMHDRSKIPSPIPAKLKGKSKGLQMLYQTQKLDELTEDDLREIKATYYGMVSRVDHQLGLLVEKLKKKGLYDNTAIFVFSDHGDYTGDYGLVEKWNAGFEDTLLHVPLIMRIPGYAAVDDRKCLVEMLDIYPTVLDLAGIDSKHYHFGRSLLPLLKNNAEDKHRNAVFAEAGWVADEKQCFTPLALTKGGYYEKIVKMILENPGIFSRAAMVRTSRYKYVYSSEQGNELYDLRMNPIEIENLASSPKMKDVETELKEMLLSWLLRTSDTVPLVQDKRGSLALPKKTC